MFKLVDENSFYSVKGKFNKDKFIVDKEMLLGMDEIHNRNLIMIGDQQILIDYSSGVAIATDAQDLQSLGFSFISDCQGGHGGTGFSQREAGESFSSCFNQERDEFVMDFLVALGSTPVH
jgi:hypothetical protein